MRLTTFNKIFGPFFAYLFLSYYIGFSCPVALVLGVGPVVVISLYRDYLDSKTRKKPWE